MRQLILVLSFFVCCAVLESSSRQLPLSSVYYMAFLNKQEFDEKFPGVELKNAGPEDAGYYLVYEHESLKYFFGPAPRKSMAELYKAELDRVVAEVKEKRERLDTAKTYIINHAPIANEEERSEENSEVSEESTEPEENEESEKSDQKEESYSEPKPEPWWKRLFRSFGF